MAFDKIIFDRNSFDRAGALDRFESEILSYGNVSTNITMKTPLPSSLLGGSGNLQTILVMQQDVSTDFEGSSKVSEPKAVLQTEIRSALKGESAATLVPQVRTPFLGAIKGSAEVKVDKRMRLYQTMGATLRSEGTVSMKPHMITEFMPFRMSSRGDVRSDLALWLPLTIKTGGSGDMLIKRLGAFNENAIELIGIDLPPGGTVTIDTDLLQVLIGAKEDVSSVTVDSVFFELNPGENEITVQTDTGQKLEVIAIWQNRWL